MKIRIKMAIISSPLSKSVLLKKLINQRLLGRHLETTRQRGGEKAMANEGLEAGGRNQGAGRGKKAGAGKSGQRNGSIKRG